MWAGEEKERQSEEHRYRYRDTDTFVYLSTLWLARKLMVKPSVTLVALGCQRGRVANVSSCVSRDRERGGEGETAGYK